MSSLGNHLGFLPQHGYFLAHRIGVLQQDVRIQGGAREHGLLRSKAPHCGEATLGGDRLLAGAVPGERKIAVEITLRGNFDNDVIHSMCPAVVDSSQYIYLKRYRLS